MLRSLLRTTTSTLSLQGRAVSTTLPARGLEDFFETPLKQGETRTAGNSWKALDLRKKSWDDLHTLWYVLLKERNLLESERLRAKARKEALQNPSRLSKVKKSMARIKLVLSERAHANESAEKKNELMRFINAL